MGKRVRTIASMIHLERLADDSHNRTLQRQGKVVCGSLTRNDIHLMLAQGHEKALARLTLAFVNGRGVRLSFNEVADIIHMDDAIHQRMYTDLEEIKKAIPT